MTLLGLSLIALGSGGIKPCVAAFGGDQFQLPAQAKQMESYFSLFYFSINSGSLISSSITPILRQDVNCFGEDGCYSLAFGVPGALMIASIVAFVIGKFMYRITPPAGNMVVLVFKCITVSRVERSLSPFFSVVFSIIIRISDFQNGIATRWRESSFNKRSHWLEYAEPLYGKQLVYDTRILLNVLVLFLPLPIFWSLFDQQGSRWTFQATRMDGDLGFVEIKPDQMQVLNSILILVFIPLFDVLFYPLLDKVGIRRPLQKLTMGGIFAGVAFICSGLVELQVEQTYPLLPGNASHQFRLYNTLPCNYTAQTTLPNHTSFELPALGVYQVPHTNATGNYTFTLRPAAGAPADCPPLSGTFFVQPANATSYFINTANGDAALTQFWDDPAKSRSGLPVLRVLANVPATARIRIMDTSSQQNPQRWAEPATNTSRLELAPNKLQLYVNDALVQEFQLRLGAVAAVLVSPNTATNGGQYRVNVVHVTDANSVNMLWQLPQYVIMTMGEVMFSVTGLAFSYAQAPLSMKSVLQACWLLTVAFGNVIDVIIVGARIFESQVSDE